MCQKLGERARVLVDLGHHAQGVNIEQIVALLADEGRLGGFHFNNRKYADDDLIVGSVNPFELFLIFFELAAGGPLPRLTIDQSHNVEAEGRGDGAERRQPAGGLRQGAARRPRRAARRAAGRRRARRPRGCCSTPTAPTSARCARGCAPRSAPRRTRSPRCAPPATPSASPPNANRRRRSPDEHRHPDRRPRRGPLARRGGAARATLLAQLVLASNLLGANRARVELRRRQHVGQGHRGRPRRPRGRRHVGQGLGLATSRRWGREHFTGLQARRGAAADRARRDERRGDGRLPRRAASSTPRCRAARSRRCCTRSSRRRTSTTPIRTASTCSPGTADGERLVHECFGDAAAWIPYIRPGFTLSKQVGEAARANPDLKLVVLAKHGLVVWGDTAEEAYRRTIEVINQAVAFVNERTRRRAALRRAATRPQVADEARARRCCTSCCPRSAAPSRASAHKLLTVDTSPRSSSSSPPPRPSELVTVGAPCPDHLVHTKRVPLWIPYDPDTDDADALRARIAERAERVPRRLPRLRRGPRRRRDRAGRPGPADRAGPAPRARLDRHDDEELARSRATSTTARSR